MDYRLAIKIIDDLLLNHVTDKIDFHLLGEPLLYKQIYELIAYISKKSHRTKIGLVTNGILLSDNTIIENIINANIDDICISVRAFNQEQFKLKNYNNLSYDQYIKIIVRFVTEVTKKRPDINIALMYFHSVNCEYNLISPNIFFLNKREVRELVNFWIDALGEKHCHLIKIPSLYSRKFSKSITIANNLELRIEGIELWRNAFLPDNFYVTDATIGKCTIYDNLNILANGDMVACCLDYDSDIVFGNLNQMTIQEICNSEKYKDFMQKMNAGQAAHPVCKKCMGKIMYKLNDKTAMPKYKRLFGLMKDDPIEFAKEMVKRLLGVLKQS